MMVIMIDGVYIEGNYVFCLLFTYLLSLVFSAQLKSVCNVCVTFDTCILSQFLSRIFLWLTVCLFFLDRGSTSGSEWPGLKPKDRCLFPSSLLYRLYLVLIACGFEELGHFFFFLCLWFISSLVWIGLATGEGFFFLVLCSFAGWVISSVEWIRLGHRGRMICC